MGTETNPVLGVLLACIVATVALVAVTVWLAKSGRVTSRKVLLGLAIVSILPIFGAGFAMMTTHVVDAATGETQSGVSENPTR